MNHWQILTGLFALQAVLALVQLVLNLRIARNLRIIADNSLKLQAIAEKQHIDIVKVGNEQLKGLVEISRNTYRIR